MAFTSKYTLMGSTSPLPLDTGDTPGTDPGAKFMNNGENADAERFNRALAAVADNTDDLNTRVTRDIATPEVGVLAPFTGNSIDIDPSGLAAGNVNYTGTLYLGESGWTGQERLDQLFQLLDEDYNEVLVAGSEVKITGISGGNALGDGFVATLTTLNLSATVPSANYRIGYYAGTTVGELPAYALTHAGLRGLEELPGEDRPADRVTYAGGPAWHDGTTNPATDVEAQLDKVVADLVSDDGSDRIGAVAHSSAIEPVPAGSVEDQIAALVARIDEMEKRDMVVRGTNFSRITLGLAASPNFSRIAVGRRGTTVGSNDSEKVYVIVGGRATAGPGYIGTATHLEGPWTSRTPGGSPIDIYSAAWGMGIAVNGSWQVVGSNGAGSGAYWGYSTEGDSASWSEVGGYPSGWNSGNYVLHDIVYEPVTDTFVAVGHDGGGNAIVGRNGYTIISTPTSPPAVPVLTRIATDGAGNLMACGSDGLGNDGLTRSTDGGVNWTDISTSLPFIDIAWEPRAQRWIALSDTGPTNRFYVSDDATGTTGWTQVTSFDEASSLAVDGRGLVLVTGVNGSLQGQIRWTTDLGATWSLGILRDTALANDADDFNRFATLTYIDGRFVQIVVDETVAGGVIWASLRQGSDIVGAVV